MADRTPIGEDFARERDALRRTLLEVGPDAPTICGDWTATDLAVHVALGELRGGWPTVPFRLMVASGLRLDRVATSNTRLLRIYRRRRGFDWAMQRLSRPAPRAHQFGAVAAVSLLELWAHHEDVAIANGLTCTSGVDLRPVISLLTRYQRKALERDQLHVPDGSPEQVARWLAGRANSEDSRGLRI